MTSAPDDERELDKLLNSLSHTEADAKANKRLSESFIDTATNALRDKIQGTKNALSGFGDFRMRLDKHDSQLAKLVKEFKTVASGNLGEFMVQCCFER